MVKLFKTVAFFLTLMLLLVSVQACAREKVRSLKFNLWFVILKECFMLSVLEIVTAVLVIDAAQMIVWAVFVRGSCYGNNEFRFNFNSFYYLHVFMRFNKYVKIHN